MTTPASLPQASKLLDLLRVASTDEMQNLLENGDLVKMMLGAKLAQVERKAFWDVLHPQTWRKKSAEELLQTVKRLNIERGWGFQETDFPSIPAVADAQDGKLRFPAIYLPDKDGRSGMHRSASELWSAIQRPHGKWRSDLLNDDANLRITPGYDYQPGVRWVELDLATYQGLTAQDALREANADGVQLAGIELLTAALLFPQWLFAWDGGSDPSYSPAPYLAGLQVKYAHDHQWSSGPYLWRWDQAGDGSTLALRADWPNEAMPQLASPTVRDC